MSARVAVLGDVTNVVFSNGIAVRGEELFIYYASCDARMHVVTTDITTMLDCTFNTPEDAGRAGSCPKQRIGLIKRNLAYAKERGLNIGQS